MKQESEKGPDWPDESTRKISRQVICFGAGHGMNSRTPGRPVSFAQRGPIVFGKELKINWERVEEVTNGLINDQNHSPHQSNSLNQELQELRIILSYSSNF